MSSNAPCAACKFLRRKCTPKCVLAPYFPPAQETNFVYVHRVFGASKVARILRDLSPAQRQDAVTTMVYEAEARLREPVYGCVASIRLLQQRLERIQNELYNARKVLATYIGPAAFDPFLPSPHRQQQDQHGHHQGSYPSSTATCGVLGMGTVAGLGVAAPGTSQYPQIMIPEQAQQQPQIVEAQQMAKAAALAAAREQEMLRSFEQQQEPARFDSGFLDSGQGYNQVDCGTMVAAMPAGAPSELPLVPAHPFELSFAVHPQHYPEQQQQWQRQPQHQRARSHYGRSGIGPSS
ncbi:hypothetical protein OPV22_027260 [Ensete ventricosum]|uniref:LOB domain-containing protein n=1 Tax=Ensete ventricosum TaxID=4639 RepID=A0AAV8PUU1_ENSVE|nr:hypothetical protein OPV22_027260 [Ensete ventricosum]RWW76196.1 hypothetical protein BHE74_00015729 [Ensete ventricosum]